MHSYWFALQRKDFILIPPNFGAFFSPFFTKKTAYPLFHGHSSHFTALNFALFFTHPAFCIPNRQLINSLPLFELSRLLNRSLSSFRMPVSLHPPRSKKKETKTET